MTYDDNIFLRSFLNRPISFFFGILIISGSFIIDFSILVTLLLFLAYILWLISTYVENDNIETRILVFTLTAFFISGFIYSFYNYSHIDTLIKTYKNVHYVWYRNTRDNNDIVLIFFDENYKKIAKYSTDSVDEDILNTKTYNLELRSTNSKWNHFTSTNIVLKRDNRK